MSKVDEWLKGAIQPLIIENGSLTSEFIVCGNGDLLINGSSIIPKSEVIRVGNWIIENYSCDYDSLIEARDMIKEAKKLSGVDT